MPRQFGAGEGFVFSRHPVGKSGYLPPSSCTRLSARSRQLQIIVLEHLAEIRQERLSVGAWHGPAYVMATDLQSACKDSTLLYASGYA